jgi:hypothetical protein
MTHSSAADQIFGFGFYLRFGYCHLESIFEVNNELYHS